MLNKQPERIRGLRAYLDRHATPAIDLEVGIAEVRK